MKLNYYISRFKKDKLRLLITFILIIIPSLEIIQHLYPIIKYGATALQPDYAFFLADNSAGRIFQPILLWFLPLYLIAISGEDCIEDYHIGYKNILVSKWSKKKYFISNIIKAFIICFFTIFIALMLDLILIHIIFHNGTHCPLDITYYTENYLYTISTLHPTIANICYSLITAFFAGIIGAAGSSLAIVLRNRKLVYPLTFVIWFIPTLFHNSLMIIIQPFSEYDLISLIPTFIFFVTICIMVTILSYMWEVKIAKI